MFYPFHKGVHFSKEIVQNVIEGKGIPLEWELKGRLKYLGHGDEAIAFETEDGKYVVKFITTHKIVQKMNSKPKKRIRKWLHYYDNRVKRGKETLKRYEKAFQTFKEEAGLVAIHIHPSKEDLPTCTVIDYLGKMHEIDMNKAAFIVQKKGEVISCFTSSDNILKLKGLFHAISQKGFVSESRIFNPHNFAIVEDRAVIIDLGKLKYAPELSGAREEELLHNRYSEWAQRKHQIELELIPFIKNNV